MQKDNLYPIWWEIVEGEIYIWTNNDKQPKPKSHHIYEKEIDFIKEQISKHHIYEGEINAN